MTAILTRNDIISGIHEVITRLRDAGSAATIQIVGGAAIALTIDEDRPATVDVDGPSTDGLGRSRRFPQAVGEGELDQSASHGSRNAHYDRTWSELLTTQPVAVLAPSDRATSTSRGTLMYRGSSISPARRLHHSAGHTCR
ncbi:hypothetical protein AB0O87_03505 [Microbacterium sp. NPDC076768]|uniref:hypothetical protein n=1 Tax=Microbacterium sp. NPDC076768 TaxID=3154858 RepID=UPI00344380C5